ncbi:MAG: hypothetical protein R2828_17060 [Saprospiraceae bacterium]
MAISNINTNININGNIKYQFQYQYQYQFQYQFQFFNSISVAAMSLLWRYGSSLLTVLVCVHWRRTPARRQSF